MQSLISISLSVNFYYNSFLSVQSTFNDFFFPVHTNIESGMEIFIMF